MIVYDSQFEQLALGLMINNEDAAFKGVSELNEDHFYNPNYRIAFMALKNIINRKKEINIYNVNEEIKTLGKVFSLEELLSIEDKFYITEKFDTIIDTLKDKSRKRIALNRLKSLTSTLQTSNKQYDELIKDIGNLYQLEGSVSTTVINSKNYIEVKKKHDEEKRTKTPILTGYSSIDNSLTYKLSLGEVSVIGARPSNGKSTLKANFTEKMCNQGLGVVNYALEQTPEVETDRLESIVTGIPMSAIANNNQWAPNDERWERLFEARKKIEKWNHHLLSGFNKSLAEMKNELRFLKSEGVSVVFWDLFDRMKEISTAVGNKPPTVTNILNQLLGLANELRMHFCVLVQMNRETEKKKDKRPSLPELKDSGGYEEVARTIFLLHYPNFYEDELASHQIEVIIAKQSNGPKLTKKLEFNPESLQILDELDGIKEVKGVKPPNKDDSE